MLLPTKTRKISVTITRLAASARPRSTALAQAVQGRWSRVEVGGFVLPRDFLGVSGGVMVRRASIRNEIRGTIMPEQPKCGQAGSKSRKAKAKPVCRFHLSQARSIK